MDMKQSQDREFRWACIGSGRIAHIVAKELLRSKRHRFVAFYSRNAQTSWELAVKNDAIVASSISEIMADENIDGVYIATPPSVHYSQIMECLSWKKPVLAEKPFCINQIEAIEIIKRAKMENVYFAEALCSVYGPKFAQIRGKMHSVGKIDEITVLYGLPITLFSKESKALKREYAGGALTEIGVYGLTFIEKLLGQIGEIKDIEYIKKFDVDICERVILDYSGVRVECLFSLDRFWYPRIRIRGRAGSVWIPFFNSPRQGRGKYIYEFDAVAEEIRSGKKESMILSHNSLLRRTAVMDCIQKRMDIYR